MSWSFELKLRDIGALAVKLLAAPTYPRSTSIKLFPIAVILTTSDKSEAMPIVASVGTAGKTLTSAT